MAQPSARDLEDLASSLWLLHSPSPTKRPAHGPSHQATAARLRQPDRQPDHRKSPRKGKSCLGNEIRAGLRSGRSVVGKGPEPSAASQPGIGEHRPGDDAALWFEDVDFSVVVAAESRYPHWVADSDTSLRHPRPAATRRLFSCRAYMSYGVSPAVCPSSSVCSSLSEPTPFRLKARSLWSCVAPRLCRVPRYVQCRPPSVRLFQPRARLFQPRARPSTQSVRPRPPPVRQ